MRTGRTPRFAIVAAVTAFCLTFAGAALADSLDVNDLTTGGNTSVSPGASGFVAVSITASNTVPSASDASGCNATGSSPAFVALSSSNPSITITDSNGGATGHVTIVGCGNTVTTGYSVSGSATVGSVITISGVASGGKSGSQYTTDSFTVTIVTPPVTDTTAPIITPNLVGTLGANGWYTSNVQISWTISDPQSSYTIDSGCLNETLSSETTGTTRSCTATSAGGTASQSISIKIDKTGPTSVMLTPSGTTGSNDWFTSNVDVAATGTDDISDNVVCTVDGAASPKTFGTETTGTTVGGECTNDAGLSTDASSISIKIDKTGPTVVVTGFQDGDTFTKGDAGVPPTAGCSSSDAISEVASTTGPSLVGTGLNANGVGSATYRCTATNGAGLQGSDQETYSVSYGGVTGFLQPINYDNSSVFKRGHAVPGKFRLAGDEGVGYDTSAWQIKRIQVNCGALSEELSSEDVGSVSNWATIRYDASADQYIYNADFRTVAAGTCWKLRATLDDGLTTFDSAVFKISK